MENSLIAKAKEYLRDYRNKKRIFSVFLVMAVIVVFCTVYALILPAITLTTSSDEDAGIESLESWQKFTQSVSLRGEWGGDALKIAKTQLKYKENAVNYVEDESGGKNGYTRYGAWSGNSYGDWNEAFILFCVHFAEIPDDALNYSENWDIWMKNLRQNGLYESAFTASPKVGDIVFIDTDGDGNADRLGFLNEYVEDESGIRITTLEGDIDGVVGYNQYTYDENNLIVGYIYMEKAQAFYEAAHPEYNAKDVVSGESVSGEPVSGEPMSGENVSDSVCPEDVSDTAEVESEGESAVFDYEDENYTMKFVVTPKNAEAESALADAELIVTPKEPDAAALLSEDTSALSDENDYNVDCYAVKLSENGNELNRDRYKIVAEVGAKSPIVEAFESAFENEAVDEAERAVMLAAVEPGNTEQNIENYISFAPEDMGQAVLTFPVEGSDIMLYAAMANPHYKVQYYAWIDTVAETQPPNSAGSLSVIDTAGGVLPKNGVVSKTKNLYVVSAGDTKYKVASSDVLTEIYTSHEYYYIKAPNMSYFNRLYLNDHYAIKEVWILKDGKSETSTNESDWTIYKNPSGIHFTNRSAIAESKGYLLIEDGSVIRLVYDTSDGGFNDAASFYDYDISNGQWYTNSSLSSNTFNSQPTNTGTHIYAYTAKQGINSTANYSGSGSHLAFGNSNTASGWHNETWANNGNTNNLNKANAGVNATVGRGCTFGIASSMSNGKIQYSSGIIAPPLFNEDVANVPGKSTYNNGEYRLQFSRSGDTYTFDSVLGTSTNNLQYFVHPVTNGKPYNNIWTNNYWPMDSAPSYGAKGHDFKHGNYNMRTFRHYFGNSTGTYPPSDDGIDHNAYFGMHFSLEFKLDADYIGPLEYLFYGDDDMWVFLDDQLICDIGGVHSSVGEHVNLWDFMQKGTAGTHKLTFFYTERGASGSTCYMRFTLPSVSAATVEQTTGQLRVEKDLFGLKGDREYEFDISFEDENGSPLLDDYAYTKYTKDGTIIMDDILVHDGAQFTLKGDEYIIVKYLPVGTRFTVTEKAGDGYKAVVSIDDGEKTESNTISGYITETGPSITVYFTNMVTTRLPATGGIGTYAVTFSGLFIMTAAVVCGYALRRRRERRQS